ncbi:MAG: NUDIX domain-containing protein [Anaerolineae bacterium]|nr:NUDIX domain-containing protein [Anaerolineae bacterium]
MMSIFNHNVYENIRTRVLVLHAGKMLLLSPYEPGAGWRLPGGGLEPNETLAECGERELIEETGIAVTVTRVAFLREIVVPKYCVLPEPDSAGKGVGYTLEVYLYAEPLTDQLEPRRENANEPMPYWVLLEDVPTLPLWPKELKTLAAVLATGNHPQGAPSFVTALESPDAPAPDVVF